MNHTFDVFIIGTGTAGDTAAGMLRDEGLSVGIADSREFGGTCALRGCQPKKYLIVPAHATLEAQGLASRGFGSGTSSVPPLDWQVMRSSMEEFTQGVPRGTREGMEARGIQTFSGECRFLDSRRVECGNHIITAKAFLIAVGARPFELTIPGREYIKSSDDFLKLDSLPHHITFIGGGYISLEFATVAAAAGARVTILQRGQTILDRFDGKLVEKLLTADLYATMDIRLETEPQSVSFDSRTGKYLVTTSGANIETDYVISGVGRVSNADTLSLNKAGIKFGKRGIVVNSHMGTSVPGIYSVGDCNDGIQLSPVSDGEARTAGRNILVDLSGTSEANGIGNYESVDFSLLPTVVFTYPQLAQFGLSKEQALERGGVRIQEGSGSQWPNYRRLNEKHMEYKVVIDEETDCILGAHILAPHAGELINLLALAAKTKIPAREFKRFPWAYPTYSADLKYMMG